MTKKEIENRFTYHKPKADQPERYEALRKKAKGLATLIIKSCPDSRERDLAIDDLEACIMKANASIARNE